MYHIVFDTTGPRCAVGLFLESKRVDSFEKEMEFGQAEELIVQIQNLLNKQNLIFDDIQMVSVCVGPGSFTGVRASVSAARAFAVARGDSLVVQGISAFEIYMAMLEDDHLAEHNIVVIETKREDFYYQSFDKQRKKLCEPQALTREDILSHAKNKQVSIVGDAIERFCNVPCGLRLHYIGQQRGVCLEKFGQMAYKRYLNKSTNFPHPLYLKAPDIMVK